MTTTVGVGHLPKAMGAIATRGPDASGRCEADGINFGHCRLSIIGLGAEGAQPMATDPDHVLVFNGEIYNYRELAADLGIEAQSDTQVLYEIGRRREYARWIHRLRGMFAFVHFDRVRGELTFGRDPFGIKPLYVRTHADGEISIGSTVSSLAALGGPVQPDGDSLAGFLGLGLFPAGTSAFADIVKVAPGTVTTLKRRQGGWQGSSVHIEGRRWNRTSVREAVEDSVAAHLVADVEVGVLLSGGIDSTLLAAHASRMQPGIRSFCLTNPDNPEIDEAGYARHNAGLLGTEHVEVPVSPATLADRAVPLIRSTGEPFSDAAYLPLSALSEVVAQHVKVALAGEGADELFGGYRRYNVERLMDRRLLGTGARAVGRAAALDRRLPHPRSQRDRSLHASALTEPADRHAALMFADWPAVRRFIPGGERAHAAFLSRWRIHPMDEWALGQPANRAFDTREWLPNVFLEKSDRASMLHSLELRTPYLDPVVARAVEGYRPTNSRKEPLRAELHRLLPGVSLPARKKGLSVDVPSLVTKHYAEVVRRTVLDQTSVLSQIGLTDRQGFMAEVEASPGLAFKVAMIGLWQEEWLAG